MPELPEVQTVVDDLNEIFVGQKIIEIEPLTDRVFTNSNRINEILNKTINNVSRRGKYIVMQFVTSKLILISHLRMTGKFVSKPVEKDLNYIRCILTLDNLEKVYFVDVRQFGGFVISDSYELYFKKLGVEPLSLDLNSAYLKNRLNRTQPVKNFLMDQQHIAGLGNIYADESLFHAKIHPLRPSKSISQYEMDTLINKIKFVLKQAILNMGTTLSDYRNTDNVAGENQNYLFVYGRNGKNCKKCDSTIEKIKLGGRGTHYCPVCQS